MKNSKENTNVSNIILSIQNEEVISCRKVSCDEFITSEVKLPEQLKEMAKHFDKSALSKISKICNHALSEKED